MGGHTCTMRMWDMAGASSSLASIRSGLVGLEGLVGTVLVLVISGEVSEVGA